MAGAVEKVRKVLPVKGKVDIKPNDTKVSFQIQKVTGKVKMLNYQFLVCTHFFSPNV